MSRSNRPWYRAAKDAWYRTVNGRKVSLGVKGKSNSRAAYEAWHRVVAGVEGARPCRKAGPTVREVVRHFLAGCEGRVKPRTLSWYRDWLGPFARQFGKVRAADLTPADVEAYSRKPEWGDASRAGFLGTVVTVFRRAVRDRLLGDNPLAGVRAPYRPSRWSRALISPEEHAALVGLASPTFRLVLVLLHATGARPGEIAGMTARDYDPALGVVRLAEHKTAHKGKDRVIYLTPEAASIVSEPARLRPAGPLLRTCWGKPWGRSILIREMIRLRDKAGVPHATLYGYRHSFATDALASGVPEAQVAELLGHTGTAMLHRHYSHLSAKVKALRSALDKVR